MNILERREFKHAVGHVHKVRVALLRVIPRNVMMDNTLYVLMYQGWAFVRARRLDTCEIPVDNEKVTIPSVSYRNVPYCGAGVDAYEACQNIVVMSSNVHNNVYSVHLVYKLTTPPRSRTLQHVAKSTSLATGEANWVYSLSVCDVVEPNVRPGISAPS